MPMVDCCKFDIKYVVSFLNRYAAAPREKHLAMTRKTLGYLKKYLKQEYAVNPNLFQVTTKYQKLEVKSDFGGQYLYF